MSTTINRSQSYLIKDEGHIFASTHYPSQQMVSMHALVQLSIGHTPLRVRLHDRNYETHAYVAGRGVRQLYLQGVPAIGFVIYPQHPIYRAIHAQTKHPVQLVSRMLFRRHDPQLLQAFEGKLELEAAANLFRDVTELLEEQLPKPPPLDPRIASVLQLIDADPTLRIEALGPAVGLSTNYLSSLFTEMMGIELRLFRLSLKLSRALRIYKPGMTITEVAQAAGFTDLQHLSSAFTKLYGASPTHFIENTDVHN